MKKLISFLVSITLMVAMTGCTKVVKWNGQQEIIGSLLMMLDISDPYVYAGFEDYIFVGTVEKIEKNVITGASHFDDNYSIYDIRVDLNMKGMLAERVVCSKLGGFRLDGTMAIVEAELPNNEILIDSGMPEQGKQYIFMANAQPDGSLLLSEIFDNRECSEDLTAEYLEYVEHQVPYDRERFTSIYDG